MGKSVEVIIDDEGQVIIDTAGFKGEACEKFTAALKNALGTVTESNKKPEFYQKEVNVNKQSAGYGGGYGSTS